MTFPVPGPFPDQLMVALSNFQWLIVRQRD